MPFGTLKLIPGVNTDATPTLNSAGVSSCNLIRSRDGLTEKLGGWSAFYPTPISSTVKDLHAWLDLIAVSRLAVGATGSLSYIQSGTRTDITPHISNINLAVSDFSSTNTSTVVTISSTGINATAGDLISFIYPVAIGKNQYISGVYTITTGGTDSFTITLPTAAGFTGNGDFATVSTSSGSPTITFNFVSITSGTFPNTINLGNPFTISNLTLFGTYAAVNQGANSGFFQISATSNATSSASGTLGVLIGGVHYTPATIYKQTATGTALTAVDYTLDNWGEVLVACPRDNPIFVWDPGASTPVAVALTGGPNIVRGIFIAQPAQIMVAYGCAAGGEYWQDPLLIRWSDAGDYTTWIGDSTNQAGSYRIPTGSLIVGGLQGPQQGIIWTDVDVWGMQYIQPPLIFGFNKLASGCGLVGQHAAVQLSASVYWMSQKQFFRMDPSGNVSVLPCTVWDQVFQNLDLTNANVIRAAANSQFNEVVWYYPTASSGSGLNSAYVKFNPIQNVWDYGVLGRSAWTDQSVLGAPIGADASTNMLYQHEISTDAAGAPLVAKFRTGYFVIGEGEDKIFLDWILPDFKWGTISGNPNAQIRVTVYVADYPGGPEYAWGPYVVTNTTPAINLRSRGRLVSLEFESDDLGSFWRLGACKYRFAPDGRN